YSKQEIKYRVSGYNKDKREVSEAEKQSIRWAVNVDGKITELAGKRGEEIVLDMPDEWAGKAIRVMACFHSFKQDVSQEVKVGPLSDKILIRMAGGASKASPGQEVEYKVTRYNVDSVIPEFGKLIKWAVKVDGKQEEQACNGETVTIKMKDSWLGKEIVVMPYLNAPTENVSVRTMVGTQSTLSIVEIKGVDKTYPRQRITYKVTKYNKEEYEMNEEDIEQIKKIKWAVRAGNNIKNLEDNEGNEFIGERIFLDINKELEGCYIFVMAYIENTEKASFKTEILRDSFSGTLIRGVEGEDEAFIGQTKTYKVLNSNKDGEAGEVSDGSDVKWAIKVGKNGNMDKSELENMRGEKIIYIKMKPEWAGKEIIIMPYLNSPTEIVSVKTEVMGGNLRAKLGETHYKAVKAIFEKTPNSAAIFRKFENELFVKKINTPVKDVEYDDINKELNLNIEADKAGIDEELKPYERTIHEIWHHIDHLAGGPDSKTFFSQSYKDELAKAAKIDFLNKVEININAINNDNATQEDYDKIAELVGEEAYFLSYKDIIAAITNGAVDYQTHPKSYWNDQTIPAEIFANIAAAKIANDEAFIVIKNKLPKIIEVYNKMLNDMRESNSSEAV
ncbi:MAG: hypothetical protein FWC26_05885, partial [Fibromonadales bacterium]|nr:hypothetical protein [Fibromonadales bacterium]